MRILIDIGHPAHVHLFKHLAWEMQSKGHIILFTCRDKEFEIQLLSKYGFKFINFGKKFKSTLGKLFGMLVFDFKELMAAIKFKPDIFISHGSIYAAHAAWLIRKPHIAMEDTYNFEQIKLYLPFTKHVLTSDYKHPLKTKKLIKYSGYHELAYLHPNRFTPDKSILKQLGVEEGEKYVIIRFVSWNASHDLGHKGISYENKLSAIEEFEKYAKVFISSEGKLSPDLERYRIKMQPEKMHDALAFASFIFGESSTMAEEAAMLGVPSIYLFNDSTFYTSHLEKDYQIMFNYSESDSDQLKAINHGIDLLQSVNIKNIWLEKRKRMLEQKIDVTAFMVWFIENYPSSARIMKENPDYQYNFK